MYAIRSYYAQKRCAESALCSRRVGVKRLSDDMRQMLGARRTRPVRAKGSFQPGIEKEASGLHFLNGAGSDLDGKAGKECRSIV